MVNHALTKHSSLVAGHKQVIAAVCARVTETGDSREKEKGARCLKTKSSAHWLGSFHCFKNNEKSEIEMLKKRLNSKRDCWSETNNN
jgi:hypothetical protein